MEKRMAMTMISFPAGDQTGTGYLALPKRGRGPGVLVLHAWWGLTPVFHAACDRLAEAGFAAFAPDLYYGKTAATVEEAQQLIEQRDFERMHTTAIAALDHLRAHSAVDGDVVGTLGFSMGAAWSIFLASERPADVAATVIFYGSEGAEFAAARAAYLGHFAEDDEWEPLEGVRQMETDMRAAGREVTFYIYPGKQHWFAEPNRPEYDQAAAELAWDRTIAFLRQRLGS
jgi:carboxymethylenebutenolidase